MVQLSPSFASLRPLGRALLALLVAWFVSLEAARAAQFTLSWTDNSTNESGFRVERSSNGLTFAEVATVGANVVSYVDTGLPNSTQYWYRICAYNSAGNSGFSNVATGTTPPLESNAAPSVSSVGNRSLYAGSSTGEIPFVVADAETDASAIVVTAASSNTTLVPLSGITLAGSGAARSIVVTPASGRTGSATVTITASDGTASTSTSFVVTVYALGTGPLITAQPQAVTISPGSAMTLSVGVQTIGAATYQWYRDGVAIADATSATYTVPVAQRFDVGSYHVAVTVAGVTITSSTVSVTAGTSGSSGSLANLSCRASVMAGDGLLIPGFVVTGSGERQILLRMVGPGLGEFGLNGLLPNPSITVKRDTSTGFVDVASNSDWTDSGSSAMRAAFATAGAFDLVEGSADAALVLNATPGVYSVVAADEQAGRTGLAMVEIYDVDLTASSARLSNLSSRGYLGAGDQVLIAGFVVADGPVTLLLRAVGPELRTLGLTTAADDPRMDLMRHVDGALELVTSNDDWGSSVDAAYTAQVAQQVSAFALSPGSHDAATVVTLPPGIYTMVAQSADSTSGVALVEVYLVP